MDTSESLTYSPPWYLIGDPDNIGMALAYGTVAMAIIWVIENICNRILFSPGSTVSLSEVATLLTFNTRSWNKNLAWIFNFLYLKMSPTKNGSLRKSDKSQKVQFVNKRALFGILMRCIVLALDFAIIFLFIPRPIPVFENDVGSSKITVWRKGVNNSKKLLMFPDGIQTTNRACALDRLPYEGFTATATRLVCFRLKPPPYSQLRPRIPAKYPNKTEIYIFRIVEDLNILDIYAIGGAMHFLFTHSIIVQSGGGASHTLPLPKNIAQQAVNAVLSTEFPEVRLFSKICSVVPWQSSHKNEIALACVPKGGDFIDVINAVPARLLDSIATHRVGGTKSSPGAISGSSVTETKEILQVGFANRPRMCIFPVLIFLAIVLLGEMILQYGFKRQEELCMNLLKMSSEATGAAFSANPLLTERRPIPLFVRTEFDTEYLSSEENCPDM